MNNTNNNNHFPQMGHELTPAFRNMLYAYSDKVRNLWNYMLDNYSAEEIIKAFTEVATYYGRCE